MVKSSYDMSRLFLHRYVKYLVFACMVLVLFHPTLDGQALTLNEWIKLVKNNHPLITVAELQEDKAKANFLKARGNFDPVAGFDWNQKTYGNSHYYSLANGEFNIPTTFGMKFTSGYEINRGLFANPENISPGNGLLFAGVSIPLGQGLWIDESRAILRQSEIGIEIGKLAKSEEFNNIMYRSVLIYLDWFQAYYTKEVVSSAFNNAEERKNAIRSQALQGDRPGLDTIEANIQWQLIFLSLQQAELELKNVETILNTFVWENGENKKIFPLYAPNNPDKTILEIPEAEMMMDVETFQNNNPFLEPYRLKGKQLEIERKFKRDKLKPVLNINYNPIFEPVSDAPFSNLTLENNKLGLSFKMPLFLRKERGEVKLTNFKISELEATWKEKISTMYGKYNLYYNEWNNTKEQVVVFNQMVNGYRRMYEAEKRLFEIGESSLFLVNTREQTYLQNMIKRLELISKNMKAYYGYHYISGRLPLMFE
ncbi:MAG: TolC family protein [Saprospiraceae bacterium]|nr:TolC family protein [Saprospiraceae bacterium]